ncbi:MAG: DinB family protein [Brevibacterium sp.]
MDEITPDTRDWAEVIDGGCAECGFTGVEDVSTAPDEILSAAQSWEAVLSRADAGQRADPHRWSALEYGAHMRDVLDLFRERTRLMIAEEGPTLPNFDGDSVALESDYAHADPAEVFAGLRSAAQGYSAQLADVANDEWNRKGYRADGREFTITSLTRYGLHEAKHHLQDVGA